MLLFSQSDRDLISRLKYIFESAFLHVRNLELSRESISFESKYESAAFKMVEKMHGELQEIQDEWEDERVWKTQSNKDTLIM